jgi:hypothetical protein
MPPNATAAEFTEFFNTMNAIADNMNATTPDPQPADFGGHCEDAPCCGCCGRQDDHSPDYSPDEESDALRALEEEQHWEDMCGRDEFYREDAEDRYLDTYWEDQSEYGMEGCCGDF